MSQNQSLNNVMYEVYPGDLNNVVGNIVGSNGAVKDLSDTNTYSTVKLHVWQPNGTLIINGLGVYGDRGSGLVYYTLQSTDTVITNAGNWQGRFITYDNVGNESDTSVIFNFTIRQAY
jgi:hypothetical protein